MPWNKKKVGFTVFSGDAMRERGLTGSMYWETVATTGQKSIRCQALDLLGLLSAVQGLGGVSMSEVSIWDVIFA